MTGSSTDKRSVLNLGCGTKMSGHPDVLNIDWSPYLRLRRSRTLRTVARPLVDPVRRQRLSRLPPNVVVHDLARGIPAPDSSADAIYSSHLLEHLDRDQAPVFMARVFRALRPGGVQRVVVPDLELLCRRYIADLEAVDAGAAAAQDHDACVAAIIEQSVRRDAYSARGQSPLRRRVERVLLGDARRRGETHQWMYDRINLQALLASAGFDQIRVHRFDTSDIEGWAGYELDVDANGGEYKRGSLYMEATKPGASPS